MFVVTARTMSANARAAGGRGYLRRATRPSPKAYVSNHSDDAMKTATFEAGQVVDASKYVKFIVTIVGYIDRCGRNHVDLLRKVLIGDINALPTIPDSVMPQLPAGIG